MIEMYRRINADAVDENFIVLDHTSNRVSNFELLFFLIFGIFTIAQIFSYNKQDILELILTIIFVIITSLLYIYRYKIFKSKIVFNRLKGTVQIDKTFFPVNKTFYFSSTEIVLKKKNEVNRRMGTSTSYVSYKIKEKNKEKSYFLCESEEYDFIRFIHNFMESDSLTLKNLQKYNRAEDIELQEIINL